MPRPHARYILIKQRTAGRDPVVDSILSGEDSELLAKYEKAKELHLSDIKKSYVEACLLASKNLDDISEIIGVPAEILRLYRYIFFDVEDYDKLTLLEIIEQTENASERGMKIWALSQGLDFIAWRLGKNIILNPVAGLQELFTLSVFKSKEALFSGNSAESSKEATKWTKLSMDLARLLKVWVMDSNAARQDIDLALKQIVPDFEGFDSLGD